MNGRDQIQILTIGYEGRSIDGFLNALEEAGVDRLVDVRELPLSRKPGFSKTALTSALEDRGIDYLHIRSLGNPKENRDRYRSGDIEGGVEVYRDHLNNGSRLDFVSFAESLDSGKACLLCFERDHSVCHRDVIVDELLDITENLEVTHL